VLEKLLGTVVSKGYAFQMEMIVRAQVGRAGQGGEEGVVEGRAGRGGEGGCAAGPGKGGGGWGTACPMALLPCSLQAAASTVCHAPPSSPPFLSVRPQYSGARIAEVPIVFVDRVYGESKLGPSEFMLFLQGLAHLMVRL
jgi:hypothetical protein